MTADISETRAQPAVRGMTTDASAAAVQPSLPPAPPPRRDGRASRNGRSGQAVRPRGSAHLIERRDRTLDEGLATLCAAVRGVRDPEQAIAAALQALGTTDPEDDTCLVALRIL